MEGGGRTPALDPQLCYVSGTTHVGGLGCAFDAQRRLTGGHDAAGGESPLGPDGARAHFWRQRERVGVIPNAVSPRLGVDLAPNVPGPKAGEEQLVCQVCVDG